jgi:hypothetical protein
VIAIGKTAPLPVRISRAATAHVRHPFAGSLPLNLRYGRRTNRVKMLCMLCMQVYGNSRVLPIRCEQHAAEQTPSCELRCCRCCCRGGCTHDQFCNRRREGALGEVRSQTRISQQASKPHPPCSHRISLDPQTTETPRNGRYSFKQA